MPAAISKKPSDRTHEENQERAYIAASRRSDRSIEARVESARRASEIHKRRTGKALQVSEKHVLAEEMYEEEEDELPVQYQNLNAHLHTGSEDFDARLQAYLANAVAFRKALTGVSKNRDKGKNVDFVNTRQLADHQALFPKHSDAWKDIILPKSKDIGSPFLPQGSHMHKRSAGTPYDPQSSSLLSRRMSASTNSVDQMDSMGTLRPSDLKPRTQTYTPVARQPNLTRQRVTGHQVYQTPREEYDHAGINYDSLDQRSLERSSSASSDFSHEISSPFSSRLPANAIDMLLPCYSQVPAKDAFDSALFDASLINPRQENTIDATLLAPQSKKDAYSSIQNEYSPQSIAAWTQNNYKDSSASRKLAEDSMWGNYIDDTSTDAWKWTSTA